MLYLIFDLDQTLYQLPLNIDFSYKHLHKDKHLDYLLSKLPSNKIIFTNGTYNHGLKCLKNINISHHFKKMIARDTMESLKPEYESYHKCMLMSGISRTDKCVFFDDMPENLIAAKDFGWITVLINRDKYLHNNIDFWFPNIYIALNFFNSKIN